MSYSNTSNIGHTYEPPAGVTYNSSQAQNYLAGAFTYLLSSFITCVSRLKPKTFQVPWEACLICFLSRATAMVKDNKNDELKALNQKRVTSLIGETDRLSENSNISFLLLIHICVYE
jgi:hypothetical protein